MRPAPPPRAEKPEVWTTLGEMWILVSGIVLWSQNLSQRAVNDAFRSVAWGYEYEWGLCKQLNNNVQPPAQHQGFFCLRVVGGQPSWAGRSRLLVVWPLASFPGRGNWMNDLGSREPRKGPARWSEDWGGGYLVLAANFFGHFLGEAGSMVRNFKF